MEHFTPESNRQSVEWIVACKSRPKQLKTQTSAGKVLATVFSDVQGILFINYLKKGRTINSKYYIESSVRLKKENRQKTAINEEEKHALIPRQCTVSQFYRNDGKTTLIALRIASESNLFSRSDSSCYWLFVF